jgi:hypothetical protein
MRSKFFLWIVQGMPYKNKRAPNILEGTKKEKSGRYRITKKLINLEFI